MRTDDCLAETARSSRCGVRAGAGIGGTSPDRPRSRRREGLNCIACHAFRGRTAAIRGPELTTMAERLEENWFHHYLTQPQRFSPLTVMPSFWPDGRTALPDVLGGDPGAGSAMPCGSISPKAPRRANPPASCWNR